MELTEELESLDAIFGNEVAHTKDRNGNVLLNVFMNGEMIATFVVKSDYPNSAPGILLSVQCNYPELERCILRVTRELISTPMLFQMVEATREWLQSHPTGSEPSPPVVTSLASTTPSDSNVCKFFLEGKCRFGDKCRFLHPTKGRSPAMDESIHEKQNTTEQVPISAKQTKKSANKQEKKIKGANVMDNTDGDAVNTKHSSKQDVEETGKKPSMRQATDVISRILWDADLPTEDFCIGYLDRFVGIIEKPFSAFSWEDIASVGPSVLSVPKHRIQYFKYRDQIVWDKRSQMDNFFGSRGGSTIYELVKKLATIVVEPSEKDEAVAESEAVVDPELIPCRESKSSPRKFNDKNRPTHFICIRITNKQAVSNILKVQDHITKVSPQLAEGCLSTTAFHITLCMVRLENEEHVATAKATLEKIKRHLVLLVPRCFNITLSGVDNFRDRLVYVKVIQNPALTKLVSLLIERFQLAGLSTPGNHSEYTPHVTIVKQSRPMERELNARIIGPALYSPFRDSPIGHQRVQSVHLCSMTACKQADGFYLRPHTISNSLVHLMPEISPPLVKRIEIMFQQGAITDDEKTKLIDAVTCSDPNLPDEEKFEHALKVLTTRQVTQSEESDKKMTVIILRGIPGSGKSFVARNSSECQDNPSRFTICSADDFFVKEGSYKFVPELMAEAHAYCLQLFLKSLYEKEVVFVDNTNSQLWEYQIYCYLCEVFKLKMHIVELPCPTEFIAEKYRARNIHSIDRTAHSTTLERWEKDERAALVPPKVAYPTSSGKSTFSLQSIVQPEALDAQVLRSIPSLFAVYTGIFLTIESQWLLVSTYTPSFPNVLADHVTLCFKPTPDSIAATTIGKKVTIRVIGHETNSGIQAVRVQVPSGVHFDADHPHITVSVDTNVSPKTSSLVLSKQQMTTKPVKTITLEGNIGLVVRELMDADKNPDVNDQQEISFRSDAVKLPTCTITSESEFHRFAAKKLYPEFVYRHSPTSESKSSDDLSICSSDSKVTDLYLFDFDGTLFHSPEPKEGKVHYEKVTGRKWPHKGWWSCPESLLPPLVVPPGPSIADFRAHLGRAGSFTAILTSRICRIERPLRSILEHASIYPDRVIMKPDNSKAVPGYAFKGSIIRDLLAEFPNVTRIKFWDDMQVNLTEVDRNAKLAKKDVQVDLVHIEPLTSAADDCLQIPTPPKSSVSSFLEANLLAYDHLPSGKYTEAGKTGIDFLASQFSQLLGFDGDPHLLVYPFGSFPLGRQSDIDVCLIAPPTMSAIEYADKLSTQLQLCGIAFTHVGRSSRCPRLKVRIEFNKAGSIDYDIVFAILRDSTAFSCSPARRLSVLEVQSILKPGDAASKTAFSGPVFLHHIQEAIKGATGTSTFASVVEMIVQILRARHQKGNAFHCIRTFHIIQLLADFVKSRLKTADNQWNSDTLFKEFVITSSQLPVSKWSKLFGEFVPHQYISQIMTTFSTMRQEVSTESFPSANSYLALRSQEPFPPVKTTVVQVRVTSSEKMLLWKVSTVVEARLPSYIHKILDSGLNIVPDGVKTDETMCVFQFAVPDADSTRQAIQQIFRSFWNEVSEYRNNDSTSVELLFLSSNSQQESDSTNGGEATTANPKESDVAKELVTQFCSSDKRELHLSPTLNSYERLLVHEVAERMNLEHKTVSRDGDTHIVLRKKIV